MVDRVMPSAIADANRWPTTGLEAQVHRPCRSPASCSAGSSNRPRRIAPGSRTSPPNAHEPHMAEKQPIPVSENAWPLHYSAASPIGGAARALPPPRPGMVASPRV